MTNGWKNEGTMNLFNGTQFKKITKMKTVQIKVAVKLIIFGSRFNEMGVKILNKQ